MSADLRFTTIINKMNAVREERGVDINGKKYSTVKDRLEMFRLEFGAEYGIVVEVDYREGFNSSSVVVAKANVIRTDNNSIVATGHAMTYVGTDDVTRTSSVEVTETNAIGRALACFGLAGGEYASAGEMHAIPVKQEASKTRYVVNGSKEPPKTEKERKFREAVAESFPPSVNQYDFTIPHFDDPDAINICFQQIDKINSGDELAAYYKAVEHLIQWVSPEDAQEIKASFRERNNQLKGL